MGKGSALTLGNSRVGKLSVFLALSHGLCMHAPSDFLRAAAAPLSGGLIRAPLEGTAGFTRQGDAHEQSPSEGRQGWTLQVGVKMQCPSPGE